MRRDTTSKSALKRSAFCEGGSGGADRRKMFVVNGINANANRIGRMVNV